jgi:hypothetical protein
MPIQRPEHNSFCVFYRREPCRTPLTPLLSSLFGASSLFTGIRLRESAFFETPTGGILDRYGRSAWPNHGTMVCPAVLLIYEIANESSRCVNQSDCLRGLSVVCPEWKSAVSEVLLESVLVCPVCNFAKRETIPTAACQFFYECTHCKTLQRPKAGDCCVFCSYGSIKCPPMQDENGGFCVPG